MIASNPMFVQDPVAPTSSAYHNVRGAERAASFLGGAFLAAWGASVLGRWYGVTAIMLGAPLLWRAATGHCALKQRLAEQAATGAKVAL